MELVSTPQAFVAVVEDSIVFPHTFLKEKLKQRGIESGVLWDINWLHYAELMTEGSKFESR
jgi:hypothetical protein